MITSPASAHSKKLDNAVIFQTKLKYYGIFLITLVCEKAITAVTRYFNFWVQLYLILI